MYSIDVQYSKSMISTVISTVYTTPDSMMNPSSDFNQNFKLNPTSPDTPYWIAIIEDSHFDNLIYLTKDITGKNWILYHQNPEWNSPVQHFKLVTHIRANQYFRDNQETLAKCFGHFTYNEMRMVHFQFVKTDHDQTIPPHCIGIDENATIMLDQAIQRYLVPHGTMQGEFRCRNFMVAIDNCFVFINPASILDFVFSTLVKSNNHTDVVDYVNILTNSAYYPLLYDLFDSCRREFETVRNQPPNAVYTRIFDSVKENDPDYYASSIDKFNRDITELFAELVNLPIEFTNRLREFYPIFISSIKKELAFELYLSYKRLSVYHDERTIIYKQFSSHPYITIYQKLDGIYKHNRQTDKKFRITRDIVFDLLHSNNIYSNKLQDLVISGIARRSELFEPMYELFIKRKNNLPNYSKEYYPYRIFYPYLFVMEHLIRHSQNSTV